MTAMWSGCVGPLSLGARLNTRGGTAVPHAGSTLAAFPNFFKSSGDWLYSLPPGVGLLETKSGQDACAPNKHSPFIGGLLS